MIRKTLRNFGLKENFIYYYIIKPWSKVLVEILVYYSNSSVLLVAVN